MFGIRPCSTISCTPSRWSRWLCSLPAIARRIFFSPPVSLRSEEHTSELQSPCNLVCRLLLEKKNCCCCCSCCCCCCCCSCCCCSCSITIPSQPQSQCQAALSVLTTSSPSCTSLCFLMNTLLI